MHNIEMLAVLQIAAGFARLDAYIYIYGSITNCWHGVCLCIGETNYPLSQMLYKTQYATRAEYLEFQIFSCILVYDWDP